MRATNEYYSSSSGDFSVVVTDRNLQKSVLRVCDHRLGREVSIALGDYVPQDLRHARIWSNEVPNSAENMAVRTAISDDGSVVTVWFRMVGGSRVIIFDLQRNPRVRKVHDMQAVSTICNIKISVDEQKVVITDDCGDSATIAME